MGKQIDPANVIGRDELIARIWKQIQKPGNRGSLRFTAERRIGKTTVMQKMAAEPISGVDVLFLEVEGIDSCYALTEMLGNRARPLLSKTEKGKSMFQELWDSLGGLEIGGVFKLPEAKRLSWQAILDKTIEQLCRSPEERLVLLMFDELPYMLQKINAVSAQHEALTLLDTLRALRQRHPNLRMIFAGSVGLHHVLHGLRDAKLAAEPVNNMPLIEIEPLEERHAITYAKTLLAEEQINVQANDLDAVVYLLIARANNVPFYMERIANQLGLLDREITRDDVEATVQKQLTSDRDPWEMEHFRERLKIYYRGELATANGPSVRREAVARCVLDHLAVTNSPQSIEQIWEAMRGQMALSERQSIVEMLKSLGEDHYLACDSRKHYSFRFELIRSWWMGAQGLSK